MQGGLPYLAQPQAGGLGGPTTLQQGPPLLPPNALPQPGVAATGGLAAPVDTSSTPSFTSVVFDGYLSDCTVRHPFLNPERQHSSRLPAQLQRTIAVLMTVKRLRRPAQAELACWDHILLLS